MEEAAEDNGETGDTPGTGCGYQGCGPSTQCHHELEFVRSTAFCGTGLGSGQVRQQINGITAYVDASNVYGSEEVISDKLRLGEVLQGS